MEIKIEKMDHTGNGIGFYDGKICFIPKSVVGDIVDVSFIKSTKKYNIGKVEKIIKSSDSRIDSICPYYQLCGGCNINNLSYDEQLEFKKNKVKNIFKKYLNLDINPNIIGSCDEYKYRNKITFHVNNKKIGLVSIDGDIIDIDNCLLVSDKVNELYNLIRKEDLSLVKKIVIRECDNGLILDIDGTFDISKIKNMCLSIYSNGKCIFSNGDGYILVNNIKYLVSNKSFFQVNTNNIKNLYDLILKYGNFCGNERVIDLYCGVGSISLYISKYVKSVLGIEIVNEAIIDAKNNACQNNIENVDFICGDVSKIVNSKIKGDVVIVDPPRVGLDRHTTDVLNECKIKKIIYVSCNPMTLVRDIKLLNNYSLDKIELVDMFPQTHHVECVCLLKLR